MRVDSEDRKRLVLVIVSLSICFSLLIVRFYRIQIQEGEKWTKIALSQHQTIWIEPFMRGSFFSNTSIHPGHPEEKLPFVIDVPKFHLFIDPDSIPARVKEQMAEELFRLLSFSPEQRRKIRSEFDRKSRCRKLYMWLEPEQKEHIYEWWRAFAHREKIAKNALFFHAEYQRSYPFGTLLGPVLHTVQEEKDPQNAQSLPTGGPA